MGYPDRDSEISVLGNQQVVHPLEDVREVVTLQDLVEAQTAVRDIFVHDRIKEYIVDIVRATRESNQLVMGSSPRGSLHLMRASQAVAAINGEDFVRPDHVKEMAVEVLSHRVIARAELRSQGIGAEDVVERVLTTVPTPAPVA